jgi:hypothetical protein
MPARIAAASLAALIAVVFACSLLASTASAATYSVYTCSGPNGESLPNDAWVSRVSVPANAAAFSFGTNCGDLSTVAAAGSALAPGENAGYAFTAPAGSTIVGYLLRRSATISFYSGSSNPALSSGVRRSVAAGDTYAGECEAKTVACSISSSDTQSAGLAASSLQVGVECAQPSAACAASKFSALSAKLINSRVDLSDGYAPTLAASGGTLTDANTTAAKRTISLAVNDLGSGVQGVALAIDGSPTSSVANGGSCAKPYTKPLPCPASSPTTFQVNVAPLTVGNHIAVVSATDGAGNVGTLAPVSFSVGAILTGSGSNSNGSPAVEHPKLTTNKAVLDGAAGKSISVRGRLLTDDGAAIAGAKLDVSSVNIGVSGSPAASLGSVRSSSDGGFVFKFKPKGAQRITFSFRPNSGDGPTATASTIVRQRLGLSAKGSRASLSAGGTLIISGRLGGTNGAAGAIPVAIEVALGKKWRAVGTVTTTNAGAYKWSHRFTRVTRPTIFRFRAVVKRTASWPWPTKKSSPVQVLVR